MKKSQLLNLYHSNGTLNRKEYLIVYISLFVLSQSISSLGSFINQQLVIFVLLGAIYFSLTAGEKECVMLVSLGGQFCANIWIDCFTHTPNETG